MNRILALMSLLFVLHGRTQNLSQAFAVLGTGDKQGNAIAATSNGAVYTVGEYSGLIEFNPGAPNGSVTSSGGRDIFITKHQNGLVWAVSLGYYNDDAATSVQLDPDGNVIVAGYYSGTIDFDPGPGIYTLTAAGTANVFILKLNPAGDLIWARSMGGTGSHKASDLATDVSRNIYICGSMTGNGDYDPGAGSYFLNMNGGISNTFISKLDKDGNFIWARQLGGAAGSGVTANAISVDFYQNVYLTGSFSGSVDFDPSAGVYFVSSAGSSDVFMMRIRPSGALHWTNIAGGSSASYGADLVFDNGRIFFTGMFNGDVDFDPGVPVNLVNGWNDMFVIATDTMGAVEWLKTSTNQNYTEPHAIVSAGLYLFIAGEYAGNADFDFSPSALGNRTAEGMNDVFVLQLNKDGSFNSVASVGGAGDDAGRGAAVSVYAFAGVVITGSYARMFSGASDFDPDSGVYNLNSPSNASEIFSAEIFFPYIIPDGLSEREGLLMAHCFPNPAEEHFAISDLQTTDILDVYNLTGERILTYPVSPERNRVDVSELSSGVYLVKLRNSGIRGRVIKL